MQYVRRRRREGDIILGSNLKDVQYVRRRRREGDILLGVKSGCAVCKEEKKRRRYPIGE